jgi:tripartite ATP-independent transporter DctM subunit
MSSGDLVGLVAILGMLGLMVVRVPIGITMLMAGGLGYVWLGGWSPLLSYVKSAAYYQLSSESFSVIPLFLLMGFLASRAGVSRTLFDCANAFFGHVRGGLAIAAIGGCGMFGAICGSSLATAATMGQVALPEMRRYGYSGSLATGALAAGGSLGILIPPSIVLVVYAILTEQNIAKLFLAAFLPGILAVLGYMAAIAIHVRLRPEAGPAGRRATWAERGRMLVAMVPVVILFLLVLGGIYTGVFTPTEAASFGVAGTLVMALTLGGAGPADIVDCLVDMAISSGMIFVILIGADLFNAFLALSGLPQDLARAITTSGLPPMGVIVLILLVYLVLGCLMDSLSMILLTLPIFFPAVMSLKLGLSPEHTAIWFGIIALIVVEVGLITPPVGLNVFVINKLAGDVPMAETFRGVVPFLISDFMRVAILLVFPFLTYAMLVWTGS